jgi:hypothetical protein
MIHVVYPAGTKCIVTWAHERQGGASFIGATVICHDRTSVQAGHPVQWVELVDLSELPSPSKRADGWHTIAWMIPIPQEPIKNARKEQAKRPELIGA